MQSHAPFSMFGGEGLHVEGGVGFPMPIFIRGAIVADIAVSGQPLFGEAAKVRFDPAGI